MGQCYYGPATTTAKDTKLRTFNNDHSKHGRQYDVFYIQQRVDSLEIADTSDYTTDQPRVRTSVLIRDARLIPLGDVSRFLTAIGTLVSAGTGEEYAEVRRNIETALTEAHETKKLKGMYVTPEEKGNPGERAFKEAFVAWGG